MRSLIISALAAAASAQLFGASELEAKFINYMATHNKVYATKEDYMKRLAIFAQHDKFIVDHNSANEYSFTLAHNKFSDWTDEEFEKMMGRRENPPTVDMRKGYHDEMVSDVVVPDWSVGVDWIQLGAVTPIKDQGTCGSCWTFSSTGALEGAWAVRSGELLSFSEQQLLDCVFNLLGGCQGSTQEKAFDYYADSHYPHLEEDYPYKNKQGRCQYDEVTAKGNVKVKEYVSVRPLSEGKLQEALASQPVAVSIDATCTFPWLRFYKSGVFDHPGCGTDLDHAVLAVGYGQLDGKNFFNVKNSWGTEWGDEGYIKLAAVAGKGMLGIQMDPLYPTLN